MSVDASDEDIVADEVLQQTARELSLFFEEHPEVVPHAPRIIGIVTKMTLGVARAVQLRSSKPVSQIVTSAGQIKAGGLTDADLRAFVARMIDWARESAQRQTSTREPFLLVYYAYYALKRAPGKINLRPYLEEHVDKSLHRQFDIVLNEGFKKLRSVGQRGLQLTKQFHESLQDEERERWAPLLEHLIAFGVGGSLVVASASDAAAERVTGDAGRTTLRRVAMHWKSLSAIAVAIAVIVGWHASNGGLGCTSKDASEDQISMKPPSIKSTVVPESEAQNIADSRTVGSSRADNQPSGLNDIEELQDTPYFRLRLLSQSMTLERLPGQAPELPRQGWWDFSELTPVPPDYADQWRRMQELERRAAEASRAGQHMSALSTYLELSRLKSANCKGRGEIEAKPSPDNGWLRASLDDLKEASSSSKSLKTCWQPAEFGQDVDFYIVTVLKRLAGKGEIPLFFSPFDGPSALGLMQYELGRGYEEHGDLQRALERYGVAIWRSFAMPERVQRMQAENLAKSNWSHLVDLMQMPQDARARARHIAETGKAEQAVVIHDDMALWFHDNNLVAVSLEPKVPFVCKAVDKGPGDPVYHFGERWQISTDYEGTAVLQDDQSTQNSGIVRRPAEPPSVPTRKTMVVHWRLKSADRSRAACSDITTRLDFCFWPDGHLKDVQACP